MSKNIEPYIPAWWLPSGHLQTLFPFWYIKNKEFPIKKETFELPDGDFIEGIWTDKPTGPTVILLHGLQGSAHSPHVNVLMDHIYHHTNWNALALSYRGCGESVQRSNRRYHGGDTEDIKFILNLVKQKSPSSPVAVVGFSLGGNLLLKLFGELKHNNLCETGIAISPPFDLHASALHMQKGWGTLYDQMFLTDIKKTIMTKYAQTAAADEIQKQLDGIRTLMELDEKITAPTYGFGSVEEYYQDSSSINYLHYIKKPTMVILAKNDPIIDYSVIPENTPYVEIETYDEGGHLGFVSGSIHSPQFWIEQRVMNHLSKYLPLGIHELE